MRRRTGELLQARDAAEYASHRQAQMLRSAADGLQMPLQALLAAVAPLPGLCAAQADAEGIEAARKALRAAEGLGRGIADLSMLARLESGAAPGDTPMPAEGAAGSAAPAAEPAGAAPQARAARLLYIEDNAINLMLMQAMIDTQPQWQLQCAAQPEAGLEIACRERPDLILLDIRLPGIDGYEVLRRLRDDARTAAIPVVAVSADAMPTEAGPKSPALRPARVAVMLSWPPSVPTRAEGRPLFSSATSIRFGPWEPSARSRFRIRTGSSAVRAS